MQDGEQQQTPNEAGWQFTGDTSGTADVPVGQASTINAGESVTWTASEFIAHHKSVGWYVVLMLVAAAAAALAYLLTDGEIFTPIIIVVVAVLFGVMAAREPRELPYKIDSKGLSIGDKNHSFANFKSFSIVQEDGVESIWLLPLQRFTPGLSIYFAPNDKDRIIAILDNYLPVEEKEIDFVDRLMHKIRF